MFDVKIQRSIIVVEVARPYQFHLYDLEELMQRGLGLDCDQHVLLQAFPFFLFVEEERDRHFLIVFLLEFLENFNPLFMRKNWLRLHSDFK